jgi:formiminoglutamate deiminase
VPVRQWWAERAWRGGAELEAGVLIETDGERIVTVTSGLAAPPPAATHLDGAVIPGLANVHSHCFHRALRARTEERRGDFWSWREAMYGVAERLDPDTYRAIARAVFAEMALAGITCVGEFHYLHHAPGGVAYERPNAMGEALFTAAAEAGIRITLLDTCYLTGGIGIPLAGVQRRFGDADAAAWRERASALCPPAHARVGAAVHSVRAVPPDQMPAVVGWAAERDAPLHLHLSEQPAENRDCLAAYGRTPAEVVDGAGALGEHTTVVHATHLSDPDIGLVSGSRTAVCMCPTTERDLADGIGPARALAEGGSPIVLGSDSHAVVDILEEARGVELGERLRSGRRGHWSAAELLRAASVDGHAALGWPEAGRLESGGLADFVSVDLRTPRAAGVAASHELAALVFAAGAADVRDVVVGGRRVVAGGRHQLVDDVVGALTAAIAAVTAT